MAGAPVDICNMALGMMGAAPIAAMTEPSEEARVCTRFYDLVRRSTLITTPWGCATVQLRLARLETDETSFAYPADCLKALRVTGTGCSIVPFTVGLDGTRRVIHTPADHPVLDYIVDLTDTGLFSCAFEQAFVHRLAAQIVLHLSMNAAVIRQIKQDAMAATLAALAADAQEGQRPPFAPARWTLAREGEVVQ